MYTQYIVVPTCTYNPYAFAGLPSEASPRKRPHIVSLVVHGRSAYPGNHTIIFNSFLLYLGGPPHDQEITITVIYLPGSHHRSFPIIDDNNSLPILYIFMIVGFLSLYKSAVYPRDECPPLPVRSFPLPSLQRNQSTARQDDR